MTLAVAGPAALEAKEAWKVEGFEVGKAATEALMVEISVVETAQEDWGAVGAVDLALERAVD